MTYKDLLEKAKESIKEENILDYRPTVFAGESDTMFDGLETVVPNAITIWLKNGDMIMYRTFDNEIK